MFSGHCECGAIEYEVDGPVLDYSHCHCGQCRRMHGAAFASFAGIDRQALRFINGEQALKRYRSSSMSERLFCDTCGSNILFASESEPDTVYLALGTVDGKPELPEAYHIFVGSMAPWYAIGDDLAQYDTEP